jgi:hypothetical protein
VGFIWVILGLCIEFYTTMLPLLATILKYFAPDVNSGIQLGDLRIMN